LTRTSQNIAPYECIDQCIVSSGSGALASTAISSRPGAGENGGVALVALGLVELGEATVQTADLVHGEPGKR
jgi:hypothetical protein